MATDLEYIKMSYEGGFQEMPSIVISETDKSQSDNIYINSSYVGKVLTSEEPTPPTPTGDTLYSGDVEFEWSDEDSAYVGMLYDQQNLTNISSDNYIAYSIGGSPKNKRISTEDHLNEITMYVLGDYESEILFLIPNGMQNLYGQIILSDTEETEPSILLNVTITKEEIIPELSVSGAMFLDGNILTWDELKLPENAEKYDYTIDNADWTNLSINDTDGIFTENSYLYKISMDDSVTSLCRNAFFDCNGLKSTTIPNSITSMSYQAHYYCSSLKRINISDLSHWCSISFTGGDANPLYNDGAALYINNKITDLVIPNDVTSISDYAFTHYMLSSITIPNSVLSIGRGAFSVCSLTSLNIPDSVISIDAYAFENCESLSSVVIGNGVTTIGDYAFENCESLVDLTIGNSISNMGESVFSNCEALTNVYINDLSNWCNIGFESYIDTPLYYTPNLYLNNVLITNLVIPNTVNVIKSYSFYNCSNIISAVIPNNVTEIESAVFYNCSALSSITLSDNITAINGQLFENCVSLESIVIPNGVTYIGTNAFAACTGLTEITLPSTITSINNAAMDGCSSLVNITFQGTKSQWYAISKGSYWDNGTGNYTIHCTDGDITKN